MSDVGQQPPYLAIQRWKADCLLRGQSLFWNYPLWSDANLEGFLSRMEKTPKKDDGMNLARLFGQAARAGGDDHLRLACELAYVHMLFPNTVPSGNKRQALQEFTDEAKLLIPVSERNKALLSCLQNGIGEPGARYFEQRKGELLTLARFALAVTKQNLGERQQIFSALSNLRDLLRGLDGAASHVAPNILLHMFFPGQASAVVAPNHRRRIIAAFRPLCRELPPHATVDERLKAVNDTLARQTAQGQPDFYAPPLADFWRGDDEDSSPFSTADALSNKKHIILHGPSATGKASHAVRLAEFLIRRRLMAEMGVEWYFRRLSDAQRIVRERTTRLRLHPSYGYSHFLRREFVTAGGELHYAKGALLNIIEKLEEKTAENVRRIPFVLILEHVEHVRLIDIFGEAIVALDRRNRDIPLRGYDGREFQIPDFFHIIATFTGSLSEDYPVSDAALPFLFFFKGFSRQRLLTLLLEGWRAYGHAKPPDAPATAEATGGGGGGWGLGLGSWFSGASGGDAPGDAYDDSESALGRSAEEEFSMLAARAEELNATISDHPNLGREFQIGHFLFANVLILARERASADPGATLLYHEDGTANDTVRTLWSHSVKPLLELRRRRMTATAWKKFLADAEKTFLNVKAERKVRHKPALPPPRAQVTQKEAANAPPRPAAQAPAPAAPPRPPSPRSHSPLDVARPDGAPTPPGQATPPPGTPAAAPATAPATPSPQKVAESQPPPPPDKPSSSPPRITPIRPLP